MKRELFQSHTNGRVASFKGREEEERKKRGGGKEEEKRSNSSPFQKITNPKSFSGDH
jgi:hypothetical protein